jgi:hypothetical protein
VARIKLLWNYISMLLAVHSRYKDGVPWIEEATRASRPYLLLEESDFRVNITRNFVAGAT